MKKKRITYGVPGMMEFETVIMVAHQPFKVLFTDGSINALGSNPAKFTTDNLMLQHSIERSKQFKSGLIKKIRQVTLDEEVEIGRNPNGTTAIEGEVQAPETKTGNVEDKAPEPSSEQPEEGEIPETKETPEPQAEGEDASLIRVEFEINDDAKDYLAENFGAVKSRLTNREAIIACGKENGVDIVFI